VDRSVPMDCGPAQSPGGGRLAREGESPEAARPRETRSDRPRACSISPLDVGQDDASERQGGPEEHPYEEGQDHVIHSPWGETLRPQEVDASPSPSSQTIRRVVHSWSTPSRLHQPEPACSCRWSARHYLHRFADDLTSCAGSASMAQQDLARAGFEATGRACLESWQPSRLG
jgi:hypothetical protein